MEKYYLINEAGARTAHSMMSFSDYKAGSKTAEYQSCVNEAYELADRIAEARPKEADRAYALANLYSKRMAEYTNNDIRIGLMCPSVMISGSGNFPVRKKEKQLAAWDKNQEKYNKAQGILDKLNRILHGKEIIKSGDADAIERLEEKLEILIEKQETMKEVNKALRMKDKEAGDEAMRFVGYSDEEIERFRTPDFCGRIGFPQFALSNNNANIRRIEGRLKELRAAKKTGTQETECEFFRVVENAEEMRIQLFFDGKPEQKVRDIVKRNGFRWAPSHGAWQRQLNLSGKYALESVKKELREVMA